MTRPPAVKPRETRRARAQADAARVTGRPAPITWQTAICEATRTGWHFQLPTPERTNAIWRQWRGRTLVSAKHRQDKRDVLRFRGTPLAGELAMRVLWVRARRAGDIDSRLKAALDLLQGIAYDNDNQIARLTVERADTPTTPAGLYVWVEPLTPEAA